MISNAEADDPESVKHCYVATLVHMYEMSKKTFSQLNRKVEKLIFIVSATESNKKDPFRAQVQWYSRVEQLPKRKGKDTGYHVDPPHDEDWEVIHEGTKFKGDVSIETVFDKCDIQQCDVSEIPDSIGKQKKTYVFFCRFALGPKTGPYFTPIRESDCHDVTSVVEKSSEKENVFAGEGGTPRSKRVPRTPSRYCEDLPSPLKNAKFSVKQSQDLCLVISKSLAPIQEDSPLKAGRARKKLNLENTPSKVSFYDKAIEYW